MSINLRGKGETVYIGIMRQLETREIKFVSESILEIAVSVRNRKKTKLREAIKLLPKKSWIFQERISNNFAERRPYIKITFRGYLERAAREIR